MAEKQPVSWSLLYNFSSFVFLSVNLENTDIQVRQFLKAPVIKHGFFIWKELNRKSNINCFSIFLKIIHCHTSLRELSPSDMAPVLILISSKTMFSKVWPDDALGAHEISIVCKPMLKNIILKSNQTIARRGSDSQCMHQF